MHKFLPQNVHGENDLVLFWFYYHQTRDKILTLVNSIQNIQQLDDYVGLEVNILRHQADILGTDI